MDDEQEEYQDEELQEELYDDDIFQIEDDEDEEDDEELQAMLEAEAQRKAEEGQLKAELKAIDSRIKFSGETTLKSKDNAIIRKAKKHKDLGGSIAKIYATITFNKIKEAAARVKNWLMTVVSSCPPLLWVGLFGLIIIGGIVIIASISIVNSVKGSSTSLFGITGNDFYGARMVYEDTEQARLNIIEDYIEFVEDGINATAEIKTITKEGSDVEVDLTVNIALPGESYDYSQFNEDEFKTSYPQLHELVFDMSKLVYRQDNNADTTATTLVECVDGILYFGYGRTVIADVSKLVSEQIVENTTFTSNSETLTKTDIDAVVQAKLNDLYDDEKYTIRTEKLFVKDYILNGDDARLSDITTENYVAMIFMPKKNVEFEKFSFIVSGENLSDLTLNLKNNGEEIALTKDDYNYSTGEEDAQRFIYASGEDLSVSANAFIGIESNNVEMFEEEHSLFDLLTAVENYSSYLELNEQTNVYTFNKNGVILNMNCSNPFTMVDYETVWDAN